MKKTRMLVSLLMALVMTMTMTFVFAVPTVSAKAVDLSATRYRYPIARFENPNYQTGVAIDKTGLKTGPYLFTDTNKSNGDGESNLFKASVEEYTSLYNMKLGKNKALCIAMSPETSLNVADSYNSVKMTLGEPAGTLPSVMPDSFKGIPSQSADHGVMFHLEFTGYDNTINNGGFKRKNTNEQGAFDGTYTNHVQPYIGITFQEGDYKKDGSPRKKAGELQSSAWHMKPGAKLTLVWTKDITYTGDNGKITVVKRDAEGKGIKNGTDYVYEEITLQNHKAGEVMEWTTEVYSVDGSKNTSGTMNFPYDFCGYVIIPFSELELCWDSEDADGLTTFRNVLYMYFTQSIFAVDEGRIWMDDMALWGPSFAKCNGAYDYGDISLSNYKESMNTRKLITVKQEEKSEEPSKEIVSKKAEEIKTALTLKNAAGTVVLEAPDTAGLKADTKFFAEAPEDTDYNKVRFAKMFGEDPAKYGIYSVYYGEDGDTDLEDFCKLTLPIPEGLDASKVGVFRVIDEVREKVENATVSEDKKTITVALNELGLLAVAEMSEEEAKGEEEKSEEAGEESQTEVSTEKADEPETKGGDLTWLWIVIGAVVVIGSGLAVFFIVKGKKGAGQEAEAEEKTEE